jgi:hypothetical protein
MHVKPAGQTNPSPAQRAIAQPCASASAREAAHTVPGAQMKPAVQERGAQWPVVSLQTWSAAHEVAVHLATHTLPGPLQTQGPPGAGTHTRPAPQSASMPHSRGA